MATSLDKNTTIPLVLLGGILTTAVVGTWKFAAWATSVESSITNIETTIAEALNDPWRGRDMSRFSERLQALNPDLKVPAPITGS